MIVKNKRDIGLGIAQLVVLQIHLTSIYIKLNEQLIAYTNSNSANINQGMKFNNIKLSTQREMKFFSRNKYEINHLLEGEAAEDVTIIFDS